MKILRVLCGYLEFQRRVQFEGCVAEPLQTITAILPVFKWSLVLQDALSVGHEHFPPLKLRVFVDDITALLKGRNKELVELAENVFGTLEEGVGEVEEKGLKLSVTDGGKGR